MSSCCVFTKVLCHLEFTILLVWQSFGWLLRVYSWWTHMNLWYIYLQFISIVKLESLEWFGTFKKWVQIIKVFFFELLRKWPERKRNLVKLICNRFKLMRVKNSWRKIIILVFPLFRNTYCTVYSTFILIFICKWV